MSSFVGQPLMGLDKGHLHMSSFCSSSRLPRQRTLSRGCSTSEDAGHRSHCAAPAPLPMLSLLWLACFPQDDGLKSSSKQPFIIPT